MTGTASTADTAGMLRIVKIVGGIVLIASFFLPLYGVAGIVNVSAMQMAFGIEVFGSHAEGSLANLLFLVPGILVLVGTLALKSKAGNILAIIGGALAVILVFAISTQAESQMGGYVSLNFEIGAWLYIIGGIASIVVSIIPLLGTKSEAK